MEQLQIGNKSLNTCIDLILQQELTKKYNHDKIIAVMLKKIKSVRIVDVNMK